MARAVNACLRRLPFLLLLLVPCAGWAHRLDEYLQATLVAIEPDTIRFEINLTPGVVVADQVLKLIELDQSGAISASSVAAYGESLKRDLTAQLDGHTLDLRLSASNFPGASELRTGWGIIQLQFSARIHELKPGAHTLSLANRHLRPLSVYLFNAGQPKSSLVQIASQTRNEDQSCGEIAFTFGPQPKQGNALGIVIMSAALLAAVSASFWPTRKRTPDSSGQPLSTG